MIDKAEKEAKEATLKTEKGVVPEPGHQPEAQMEKTAETKEAEFPGNGVIVKAWASC